MTTGKLASPRNYSSLTKAPSLSDWDGDSVAVPSNRCSLQATKPILLIPI
jgi:hypothetical protein